jgi:large subunit ribosomal protein L7e
MTETFVDCFRIPSLKTVKEIIYKKGYGRIGPQKVPLTDNAVIERELGR